MQLAQRKNWTCFGISNSKFCLVEGLCKFGGCLVDNFFYLLKAGFKLFTFNSIQAAKDFFQVNIMVQIVGSDNAILLLFSV